MTIHIDDQGAYEAGDRRHGVDIMRSLGIRHGDYQGPPNIGDCWLFYDVDPETVPVELPAYVEVLAKDYPSPFKDPTP